jgi:hypothetical protein
MNLQDLHEERDELAAIESEASDAMKYTRVGGFWWRVFQWFERRARADRREVEDELRSLGYPARRGDE